MRTITRRVGSVKIALLERETDDAVWIEWLLFMAGVSSEVSRVDWARPEIGDAQLILIGLQSLDAPEKKALARLHARFPSVPVVILAGADASSWVGDAVQLGAMHLLYKNQLTPEALSSTIRYCAQNARA